MLGALATESDDRVMLEPGVPVDSESAVEEIGDRIRWVTEL